MKPSFPRRSGVLTLRTLGRGFWLGTALSLFLHAWLLGSGSFSMPRWDDTPEKQTPIEARLEPAQPEILAGAAALPPPPPVLPAPALPVPPAAAAPAPPPLVAAEPVPAPAAPDAETVPAPSLAPAAPAAAAPMPAPASAQVSGNLKELPRKLEIVFELNGMLSGRQTHRWLREGDRYTLETEGEVTGIASLFVRGKLTQTSRGRIGPLGLMPEQYEMQRPSGKKEALRFDYPGNVIEASRIDAKSGKRSMELPMLTGAQDPLSAIYQLAMAAQEDGEGLIVAAGAKRIKGYPYRVLGSEKIDTALGSIRALHVTRSGDSASSATHLWLSPAHHYLPVRVTYVDDEGTEWVLQAASIKVD